MSIPTILKTNRQKTLSGEKVLTASTKSETRTGTTPCPISDLVEAVLTDLTFKYGNTAVKQC